MQQPSISIKEILRLAMPRGAHLVAGDPARTISWVRRTRVQPPAFLNLEPGELVLINTETLRLVDERLNLARVVESLAGVGVAAIGVQGKIDQAAIEQAEIFDMPLLFLPEESRLLDIEREVSRLLIDREAQLERRAQEIAGHLAALAAENRGLDIILAAVTRTTGKVAVIHNINGEPVTHTAHTPMTPLEVQEVENRLENGKGAVLDNGYTVPLIVEGRRAGYLTILNGGMFDDLDRVTAERGAMVCAMELAKQKAVVDAETRMRGDWVQRWLSGEAQDDAELEDSAIQTGMDLGQPYAVALFRADADQTRLIEILRTEMASRRIEGIVGQAPGGALVFYPMGTVPRTIHVTEAIRKMFADRLQTTVRCGLGQPTSGLSELRKSYRQAERALQMSADLCPTLEGCTLYFGDLNLYRLLLSVDDPQELQRFCEETLGAVLDYDERHDGELTRTLDAFFSNNGNLARTAEELCVHRNTLSYRLGRVSDITGVDLDDAETRLMLHLALKVRRVLRVTGQ